MFSKWHQRFVKYSEPFFVKKLKILYTFDHTILFRFHQHVVQILIKQYGETSDFQCQHQQYGRAQHKYPIEKSIFAVHLPYTVANADIGNLKFL